jgi:hypothetical protein
MSIRNNYVFKSGTNFLFTVFHLDNCDFIYPLLAIQDAMVVKTGRDGNMTTKTRY